MSMNMYIYISVCVCVCVCVNFKEQVFTLNFSHSGNFESFNLPEQIFETFCFDILLLQWNRMLMYRASLSSCPSAL